MCAKRKVSQKVESETTNRREGVYNRAGESSVTFCEEGAAAFKANGDFCKKVAASKITLAATWSG